MQLQPFDMGGESRNPIEWQAKAHDDGASPFYYMSPLIENLHKDPRHFEQMRSMGWNRSSI